MNEIAITFLEQIKYKGLSLFENFNLDFLSDELLERLRMDQDENNEAIFSEDLQQIGILLFFHYRSLKDGIELIELSAIEFDTEEIYNFWFALGISCTLERLKRNNLIEGYETSLTGNMNDKTIVKMTDPQKLSMNFNNSPEFLKNYFSNTSFSLMNFQTVFSRLNNVSKI